MVLLCCGSYTNPPPSLLPFPSLLFCSIAALLGNLLCWHEDGITDAEWGERFYQWGVAVGISEASLNTITFTMLKLARSISWVGRDTATVTEPDTYTTTQKQAWWMYEQYRSYNPKKSRVSMLLATDHTLTMPSLSLAHSPLSLSDILPLSRSLPPPLSLSITRTLVFPCLSQISATMMSRFLAKYDAGVAPLIATPGVGKKTLAALATGGGGLEHTWEPPVPGQDESYRIPITSFPSLMGHLLILHHETIDVHVWADRFVAWGASIGMRKDLLHPIVCALLELAQFLPVIFSLLLLLPFVVGTHFIYVLLFVAERPDSSV